MRVLNDQEIELILNDTMYSTPIDQTLSKLGMSRLEFAKYRKTNPEIDALITQAELDSCFYIENDMVNVTLSPEVQGLKGRPTWKASKGDSKLAAIKLNALAKRLSFLKPDKYGNKIDVNLNQTISIRSNLEQANKRIADTLRDVTPITLLKAVKVDAEDGE